MSESSALKKSYYGHEDVSILTTKVTAKLKVHHQYVGSLNHSNYQTTVDHRELPTSLTLIHNTEAVVNRARYQ